MLWGIFCILRSAQCDNSYRVYYVNKDGNYNNCNAYQGVIGLRPAQVDSQTQQVYRTQYTTIKGKYIPSYKDKYKIADVNTAHAVKTIHSKELKDFYV